MHDWVSVVLDVLESDWEEIKVIRSIGAVRNVKTRERRRCVRVCVFTTWAVMSNGRESWISKHCSCKNGSK